MKLFSSISEAAEVLRKGGIVAFPTETVYGLGATVLCKEAIERIYKVKKRPSDNPLIIHVENKEVLLRWIEIEKAWEQDLLKLIEAFCPGPLTFVVKSNPIEPSCYGAALPKIAIRIPGSPLARKLIESVGSALVAPSANLSGRPSATKSVHVIEDFGDSIEGVLEGGDTALGMESTVIELVEPCHRILRLGSIPIEDVEAVLGKKVEYSLSPKVVLSPGMKYKHYQPSKPLYWFSTRFLLEQHIRENRSTFTLISHPEQMPAEYASLLLQQETFYACLRKAEGENIDYIYVLFDPKIHPHPTLEDRLQKASTHIFLT